jgi:hypothetical protein
MPQARTTKRGSRQTARKASRRRSAGRSKWSARVTQGSDALTLEDKVFTREPAAIARSLKRSAERSRRRKAGPFQSAMSMLNFYLNRAGRSLPAAKRRKAEKAKDELRKLFKRA